jgi:hypothetical protein
MAVGLSKSAGAGGSGASGGSGAPDVEGFRGHVPAKVFDAYCEASAWRNLVEEGVRSFGLDRKTAELALDMELERLGVANETALLRETEAMLKQFTDRDRKLDGKERSDIVQLACRAKSGYSKGLRHEVAEAFIVDFCRQNGVKVKVGLFKWAVP